MPVFGLYLVLGVVERQLNGYLIFHYHQYICSMFADLCRFLALGLAILLAIGDRFDIPLRPLRFALVFLFLFLICNVQIALNAWPFLDAGKWTVIFGVMLFVFMLGNSIVSAVLRSLVNPRRFPTWYAGFCAAIGLVPLVVLGGVEAYLSRSVQLQSTQEHFRVVVVLATALCVPYAVHFAFLLLALRSPLYRNRFARVFGLRTLQSEAPVESCPEPVSVT